MRFTPKEVAERYRCKPSKVIGWIRSGELEAINIGDGDTKPRFLITECALQLFEEGRAFRTDAPAPRRRTKPKPRNIRRYF